MELSLTKFEEKNTIYRKGVSAPNFSGGLKLKGLKKDSLKFAAGAAAFATSAAALHENNETKENNSKLTLNKVLFKNFFRMDLYTRVLSIEAFKKTPKENRKAFLNGLNFVQENYKKHEFENYYRNNTIGRVLPNVNEENLPLFKEIVKADIDYMKNNKYRRYSENYAVDIMNYASEENLEKFKIISSMQNEDGKYIYDEYYTVLTLKSENAKPKYLKEIANSERSKTMNAFDVSSLTKSLTPENEAVLLKLLDAKTDTGSFRIDKTYLVGLILENTNIGNIDAIETLLNVQKHGNRYVFDGYDLSTALKSVNKDNCNTVKNLFSEDKYRWLYEKTSMYEYSYLIDSLNSNNSEILPLVLNEYKNGILRKSDTITSIEDVSLILKNVSNEEKEVFESCLKFKERNSSDDYYFNNHNIKSLPDLMKVFSSPELSPIANKLLEEKTSDGHYRFLNIDGIKELCEIINENDAVKNENLDFVLGLQEASKPRFTDMRNVVNITNIMSDETKKDKMASLLTIKNDDGFRFNDFTSSKIPNIINQDLDIEKVKVLSKIKDTRFGGYSLSLSNILYIASDYTDMTAAQLPVPEVLPPRTDLFKVLGFIYDYQNGNLNLSQANLKDKIMFDTYLSTLENLPATRKKDFLFSVESLKRELQRNISRTITPTEVSNENAVNLFRTVFSNKAETENVIKNTDFSQYGKSGLPLLYSRKDFMQDLNKILTSVDDEKAILEKLQIELTPDRAGYDGIINLQDLNKENDIEKNIYDICEKFILKNEINTGDNNFDNIANALIKGIPEFVNIIGKQPHASHDYSIDIHIMEVLKNCLNHPEYQNLSSLNKTKLKMAVMLHDIAKKEGVVDKNHQNTSALYTRNILEKYKLPKNIKDDTFLLVKNHHWLEALNTNAMTKEALSCNFKNSDDFKMSKIFAYSDLKGVSQSIFEAFSPVLDSDAVKELENAVGENSKTGNSLFTSRVIYQNRIPQETLGDKTYKVFDFASYPADKDLSEVGFLNGTKKKDLRFLLHAVSNVENLKTVETLSDVANNSILSESFISLDKSASYYGDGMGVILETDNQNIVNAYFENQGSGYGKTQEVLVELKTSSWKKPYRDFLPSDIQNTLDITEEQYAKLYEIISQKKYVTQIDDTEKFDLGGKIVNGKDIKAAIEKAQDSILSGGGWHNEVIAQNSKVVGLAAKENSLENISPEYLEFAQHYNLPVYLLGK